MIRIDVYLPNNDVMIISEGLKKIDVGGLTVIKKRGRGKKPPPEIHAGKGSMIFRPQFTEKYVLELFVGEEKVEKAIEIIRQNASRGKIMVTRDVDMIDIETGDVNNET